MAGQYLKDLPSRGNFANAQLSSTLGGLRIYICDHDTAPPENQLIKTDATNILIRYLNLKKGKADQKKKVDENKGKRPADRFEEKGSTKRINVSGSSTATRKEGGCSRFSERELQTFTVQKIKSLLKERGQPLKGNKDELIARLKKAL